MARYNKPQTTSPNKVLVIFLVFFILSNIGFAVWVYTLSKDRDKWDVSAKSKDAELKLARQEAEWNKYQRDELLAAIGEPEFNKKAEARMGWKDNRDFFLKGEKFKNEEGDEEFKKLIKSFLETKLGGFEDGYKEKFADLADALRAKLAEVQKNYAEEVKKNAEKQQEFLALQKKYNADRDAVMKEIKDGNAKALEARANASEAMTAAIKQNEVLAKANEDLDSSAKKELASKDARIRSLEDKIKGQEGLAKSPNRSLSELHALLLDVSKGKPLWDMPRGKIIRVEDSAKKVYIDKGSKDGVKPGLTFAVFEGGSNGRGGGKMKATIEVIRVLDAGTSLCKVNTFYDVDGNEILVAEATPARVLREGPSTFKQGDLLFNLFWGSHVAIVGIVDFPGFGAKSAAGQMDDLRVFMGQLERMGITVDAYSDLRDGKLIGELSPNTNFVIRGSPAVKQPDAPDDSRVKGINEAIAALRAQAAERGMFIISPANFAVLSGYRRTGDDGRLQTLTFVPGRPAGSPVRDGQPNPEIQKKDQ